LNERAARLEQATPIGRRPPEPINVPHRRLPRRRVLHVEAFAQQSRPQRPEALSAKLVLTPMTTFTS
jgi:hypothetical protein